MCVSAAKKTETDVPKRVASSKPVSVTVVVDTANDRKFKRVHAKEHIEENSSTLVGEHTVETGVRRPRLEDTVHGE